MTEDLSYIQQLGNEFTKAVQPCVENLQIIEDLSEQKNKPKLSVITRLIEKNNKILKQVVNWLQPYNNRRINNELLLDLDHTIQELIETNAKLSYFIQKIKINVTCITELHEYLTQKNISTNFLELNNIDKQQFLTYVNSTLNRFIEKIQTDMKISLQDLGQNKFLNITHYSQLLDNHLLQLNTSNVFTKLILFPKFESAVKLLVNFGNYHIYYLEQLDAIKKTNSDNYSTSALEKTKKEMQKIIFRLNKLKFDTEGLEHIYVVNDNTRFTIQQLYFSIFPSSEYFATDPFVQIPIKDSNDPNNQPPEIRRIKSQDQPKT